MNELVDTFIEHIQKLGLINGKTDIFIIKRRYNMLHEQYCKENPDASQETIEELFDDWSIEILGAFFEERTDEMVEGVIAKWREGPEEHKIDPEIELQKKLELRDLRVEQMQIRRSHKLVRDVFEQWKLEHSLMQKEELKLKFLKAEEKIENLHEINTELQVELTQLAEKFTELQEILTKEREENRKKKKIAMRRKKMRSKREESKSMSLQKALNIATKQSNGGYEDPYMIQDRGSISGLNKRLKGTGKGRQFFSIDQRGSSETMPRQHPKNADSFEISSKRSVATASVFSERMSEWSFHPEINRSSKWKPKYDDHYDHKKMWERMHDENEKINSKRRQKKLEQEKEELALCTFIPELMSNKSATRKEESLDMLSDRLYQYAEKFKNNRDVKKRKYEKERGQEIRFKPKLETEKTNKKKLSSRNKKQVYQNLYKDFSNRIDKMKEKIHRRDSSKTRPSTSTKTNKDLKYLSSKYSLANNMKKPKRRNYANYIIRKGEPGSMTLDEVDSFKKTFDQDGADNSNEESTNIMPTERTPHKSNL